MIFTYEAHHRVIRILDAQKGAHALRKAFENWSDQKHARL